MSVLRSNEPQLLETWSALDGKGEACTEITLSLSQ